MSLESQKKVSDSRPLIDLLRFIEAEGVDSFLVTANGRSMFPVIVRGDRIFLERIRTTSGVSSFPRSIVVGDIVLASDVDGRLFIHRIIKTSPLLVTKGDFNSEEDRPLARVIAVVVKIEPTWRSTLRRVFLKLKLRGGG